MLYFLLKFKEKLEINANLLNFMISLTIALTQNQKDPHIVKLQSKKRKQQENLLKIRKMKELMFYLKTTILSKEENLKMNLQLIEITLTSRFSQIKRLDYVAM